MPPPVVFQHVLMVFWAHFPTSRHKMFQVLLSHFPAEFWFFLAENSIQKHIWVLDVLTVPGLSLLLHPFICLSVHPSIHPPSLQLSLHHPSIGINKTKHHCFFLTLPHSIFAFLFSHSEIPGFQQHHDSYPFPQFYNRHKIVSKLLHLYTTNNKFTMLKISL